MELVKEVTVEEALKKGFKLVDVRTEEEFEEFHIPGAINVPLFTQKEREEVSKVYYSKGEKEARLFALKLVAPKLYDIVTKIREVKERYGQVAVYCWRGGMRSLAVATICNLVGVHVFRLKGGYRAFRQFVLKRIAEISEGLRVVVLYGPTGVGKTRILRELKEEEVNKISLISPRATINIIRDYEVVEKRKVEIPEIVEGVLKCANPNCITNFENVTTKFSVEVVFIFLIS
ncbi:MAG: hypothetical protein DSY35_01285 [Desulfurobacterium sp.]|nr:MAG: hypothetical protein DSY35_01285 [Desulfurobacterium sp.]